MGSRAMPVRDRILPLLTSGMSNAEIARAVGCNRNYPVRLRAQYPHLERAPVETDPVIDAAIAREFPVSSTMHAHLRERFFAKFAVIDDEDSCWEWTASRRYIMSAGRRVQTYGNFKYGDTTVSTHRLAWEMANGRQIPDGLLVRHRCDNYPCNRPRHLLLGTYADNAQDMSSRGRAAGFRYFGENNQHAKLTDAQAIEIRQAVGIKQRDLAAKYGISQAVVHGIRSGKAWKHLAAAAGVEQ